MKINEIFFKLVLEIIKDFLEVDFKDEIEVLIWIKIAIVVGKGLELFES